MGRETVVRMPVYEKSKNEYLTLEVKLEKLNNLLAQGYTVDYRNDKSGRLTNIPKIHIYAGNKLKIEMYRPLGIRRDEDEIERAGREKFCEEKR